MDIIRQAFRLMEAVTSFAGRVRKLYYAVVLLGHSCPKCDGKLMMVGEGLCRCRSCSFEFDPTVAFQRCSVCGGTLEIQLRRYRCKVCGSDITSRFLFDGLVFDRQYFRQKMVESRRQKKQRRERVRKMLAESRSGNLQLPVVDLSIVPGLEEALNSLTVDLTELVPWVPQENFDLKRYQSHIQAHIRDFPISLDEIPALGKDTRKDRIWRFIAVIFLAHMGIINIWQDGQAIMVIKSGSDTERYGIHEDTESVDGLEGSMGGAQAW